MEIGEIGAICACCKHAGLLHLVTLRYSDRNSFPDVEYFYEMPILDTFLSIFSFKTLPTTLLVLLAYAVVFTSVLVTDELPNVPNHRNGLNISKAYTDLRVVRVSCNGGSLRSI